MRTDDGSLLHRYAQRHSNEAFGALVERHLNLVYSVALRQVRSPELAQEVSQSVFVDLAKKAATLKPDTILTAWLYRVAYRTAVDVVRQESRRQAREQIAMEMATLNAGSSEWTQIEPLLDEMMGLLDEEDHTAILLRYFDNKSLREVGQVLGISEDTAQKRVSRAVERLREFFSKRGADVGASGLALVISVNAVQAAPAGMAATISAAAVMAGSAAVGITTATVTKVIAMTILQKAVVTATVAIAVGAGIYEARQAATSREQVQALQDQQTLLSGQIQQLQRERDDESNRVALLSGENLALKNDSAELQQVRGELSELKTSRVETASAGTDEIDAAAGAWLDRVAQLKRRMEQTPGSKIPELKLVTEKDWLNAAAGELDTDIQYRRAMSLIRAAGENKTAGILSKAVVAYAQANSGQFPTDLSQLQPYFAAPVDDAILQRWAVVPASDVKGFSMTWANGENEKTLITQKVPVDEVFDTQVVVGPQGMTGNTEFLNGMVSDTMKPVWAAYQAAHDGRRATTTSQVEPYLTTPEQRVAFDKLMLRESASK